MKKSFKYCVQVVCCLAPILSTSEALGWPKFEQIFDYEDIFDAVDAERIGNIERLLEKGANIEKRNSAGYTPLLYAVRLQVSEDTVEALLNLGADLEARDSKGNTALLLSCRSERYFARRSKSPDYLASILLSYGADIEAKNKEGNTPLIEAALNGEISSLRTLVESGANLEAKNNNGFTALMVSADNECIHSAQFLLAESADIDITDERGVTPLMLASFRGNLAIIQMLLQAGADANSELLKSVYVETYEKADPSPFPHLFDPTWNNGKKNVRQTVLSPGATALDFAELFGGLGAVKLLLENGAKENPEMEKKLDELRQKLRTF